MIYTLEDFIREYSNIFNMGLVKTHRAGPTGIGKTLEDLLGIQENNIDGPDFGDYELKSCRINSNMRMKFHATAQEAVKTSGVIFRKEDRIPYEKRNECKRPDHISVGGRLPRRYFNRQRTHLYFACR